MKAWTFSGPRLVLRPQEISNNPGIIRRLCVIAMNTALEVDVYGNVNVTHVGGTQVVNGIGGSADFCRNSYLSILMWPFHCEGRKNFLNRSHVSPISTTQNTP